MKKLLESDIENLSKEVEYLKKVYNQQIDLKKKNI